MDYPILTQISKRGFIHLRAVADWAMAKTPEEQASVAATYGAGTAEMLNSTGSVDADSDEMKALEADLVAMDPKKMKAAEAAIFEASNYQWDNSPEGWIALQALETVMYAEEEHGKRWAELKESDPVAFRKVLVEASGDVIHGIFVCIDRVAKDVAEKSGMTAEQVTKITMRTLLAIDGMMREDAGIRGESDDAGADQPA